jgi:hypothetical protein
MKTKIFFALAFAFAFAFHFSLNALSQHPESSKQNPATGYLVAITSHSEGLKITRTTDLVDVYALAEIHFPNNCVDFARELRHSVYYEIESQHKGFFVEVKRINRNGKYRRMSNREFRVQSSEFGVHGYVGQNKN